MMVRAVAVSLSIVVAAGTVAQTGGSPAAAGGGVRTTATPGGPSWSELTPDQQTALAPLKNGWDGLDAARKAKWIVVAQRFPSMPAEERQRVQARMAEWAAMSPAERGRARQNFQELRKLPADDRQALWDAYRALPPEQRKELAQRAKPAPAPRASEPAPITRRVVPVNPPPVAVKPVTPTVVQVKPGATTTLVNKPASPPLHNQPGLPKIVATPSFVDPATLLPKRGPQGAATLAPAAAASARAPEAAGSAASAASAASAPAT